MKDIRQTKHITALYERLSHDEDGPGESSSIQNQKKVLEQYAQQHGFRPIRHYTDDGISGGTFERPGWKRLIADVEAGEIGCVLVKDMSRIGRDYLQVGYYTEVFFPEKGVRFIAVSNAIDSQEQESGEFAPFLNVMSEYYLHDLSRKIRGAVEVKAQAGQHLSNRCPYGYRKDPEDGNHWLVDEEAAAVVLRIFHMALEGLSANTIAKRLSAEQIPTPRYYRFQHSGNICKRPEHPTTWSSKTVKDILSMPDYMGWTVNRKRRSDTYKDKARRTSPENWQIVRGTQDAIVDEALWNRVQAVRQEKKGPTPRRFPERHPLDGVVFCADCGAKLFHQREHGKGRRKPKERFLCSSHLYAAQRGEKCCSRHSIATADLTALVLDSLRTVCGCALSDEAAFLDAVQKSAQTLSDDTRKELRQRIRQSQRRSAELDRLIQALYEGNVLGTVSDKRFVLLSRQYETEQAALEAEIAAAQELLTGWETVRQDGKRFVALANRLSEEKIERPSYYLGEQGVGNYQNRCDTVNACNWRGCTVASILAKPEYMGWTVNFRTYTESYKDKKRKPNDRENWAVFENTQEQADLEQVITQNREKLAVLEEVSSEAEQVIRLARKYTDFTELTTPMLNEFVDKIVVHEPEKVDGERFQEVEIHLKFIGKVEIPVQEPTPEELEQEEKLRNRRAKKRENSRRYYQRKREEKATMAQAAGG